MKKYVKGDVSIRDSFEKKVSQNGLGSHRPHGTRAGLITIFIVCTIHVNSLDTCIFDHVVWFIHCSD
jgi:hypothetical protein